MINEAKKPLKKNRGKDSLRREAMGGNCQAYRRCLLSVSSFPRIKKRDRKGWEGKTPAERMSRRSCEGRNICKAMGTQ